MQKPSGYNEVNVGDFTPIELGGHHAIIKDVKESQTRTGKPMIIVAIDFAPNDKQPGYFMDSFEKDIRPEKKWPYQAVQYIVTVDKDNKTNRSFKGFIRAFEDSNGCEAVWGDAFCRQFKNKRIGVVYGNVEEEYNGERKMRRRIRWFCNDAVAENAKVPEDKLLSNISAGKPDNNGFVNISNDSEEEIPF